MEIILSAFKDTENYREMLRERDVFSSCFSTSILLGECVPFHSEYSSSSIVLLE